MATRTPPQNHTPSSIRHSLELYRRHTSACVNSGKDQAGICHCTLWIRGRASAESEPIRHTLQTSDLGEAERQLRDIAYRAAFGDPVATRGSQGRGAQDISVSAAIAAFTKQRLENPDLALALNTKKQYKRIFKVMAEVFGDRPLASLQDKDFTRLRQTGRGHIAGITWSQEIQLFRVMLKWASAPSRKWVSDDPTREQILKARTPLVTPPFNHDEVDRMLDACDRITMRRRHPMNPNPDVTRRRARGLILVFLYSGLRISDVARLKRSALDHKTGYLVLRTIKSQDQTQIKVQLPEDVVDALLQLPRVSDEYFFWDGAGKTRSLEEYLRNVVALVAKEAGVKGAHPHRFRDTFAVELLGHGEDLRVVQLLLGHSSITITEKHYAHFVPGHQKLLDAATSKFDFLKRRPAQLILHPGKGGERDAERDLRSA